MFMTVTKMGLIAGLLSLAVVLAVIADAPVTASAQDLPDPLPENLGLPEPDQCDSLGRPGTLYVTGVNCRLGLVDGYPRAYIVYVPANVDDPAPVVFMFHGGSGTGLKHFRISGWREKADEEGLVAVFPTGLTYCKVGRPCESGGQAGWTTHWHDYSLPTNPDISMDIRPPNYPADSPWPADDVGFTQAILDDLKDAATGLSVDPDRVYASGFSNGGGMTARLAIELSEQLAAVAYTSGGDLGDPALLPTPVEYIPVYAAMGTHDHKLLGSLEEEIDALPLDPAELFAIPEIGDQMMPTQLEGFDHTYDPETFVPYLAYRATTYTLFRWRSISVGGPRHIFRMAFLSGLDHTYPNGCPNGPKPNNPECFQATDQFWPFFERHPKPSEPALRLDDDESIMAAMDAAIESLNETPAPTRLDEQASEIYLSAILN